MPCRKRRSKIQACADVGFAAARRDGLTGVWVEDRKLASIGIYDLDTVEGEILYSTLDPDDDPFVPLGMPGKQPGETILRHLEDGFVVPQGVVGVEADGGEGGAGGWHGK